MVKVGKIGVKSLSLLGMMVLVFTSFFFISPQKAKAADIDHLVINEIYPAPDSKCNVLLFPGCDKEWIELYNPTGSDVNLSAYTIEDGKHTPKLLSGNVISGGYYVLISGTDFSFGLNDLGDYVGLNNGSSFDSVSYGNWNDGNALDNAIKPDKTQSISRIPNGQDTENDKDDFKIVAVTKGVANISPPPVIYSDAIIINEIVPEPADGTANEFVELYNSGEEILDLGNWQLDDSDGGSTPYNIPLGTKILPKQFLAFYNLITKISLNDTGDSVRLIDPNKDVRDTISYYKAERGLSYSLIGSEYKWTKVLTPNAENFYQVELAEGAAIQLVDISTAKGMEDGTQVCIVGFVTVLPGVLSSQYFYVQDDMTGIQVYSYSKYFPTLSLGQKVQVNGELSTISGERRLKIFAASDIAVFNETNILQPQALIIENINKDHIGELVMVTGTVTKTSGDTFYLSDGSKEIKVVIRDGTNIEKPKMRQGDTFAVTGVLSTYGGELRILPIDQNDVTILASKRLPTAGPNIFGIKYLILNIIAWNLLLIQKKRHGSLLKNTQKV